MIWSVVIVLLELGVLVALVMAWQRLRVLDATVTLQKDDALLSLSQLRKTIHEKQMDLADSVLQARLMAKKQKQWLPKLLMTAVSMWLMKKT